MKLRLKKQLWQRKVISKGSSGDINYLYYFDGTEDVKREANFAPSSGNTDLSFILNKVIIRFEPSGSLSDIREIMDSIVLKIYIEGDDLYKFLRPARANSNIEFIYDLGARTVSHGKRFNATIHFSKPLATSGDVKATVVFDGMAEVVLGPVVDEV